MLAHSSALRLGRYSQSGGIYLITTVTHQRAPVFEDFVLARLAITELRTCDERGRSNTLAFVLMPDHLHWLVQLQHGTLSALVGNFKANASKMVHRHWGTPPNPSLWQDGFHDRALRSGEDLTAVARYIVRNPVRAGLVAKVGDYPHWNAATSLWEAAAAANSIDSR